MFAVLYPALRLPATDPLVVVGAWMSTVWWMALIGLGIGRLVRLLMRVRVTWTRDGIPVSFVEWMTWKQKVG